MVKQRVENTPKIGSLRGHFQSGTFVVIQFQESTCQRQRSTHKLKSYLHPLEDYCERIKPIHLKVWYEW